MKIHYGNVTLWHETNDRIQPARKSHLGLLTVRIVPFIGQRLLKPTARSSIPVILHYVSDRSDADDHIDSLLMLKKTAGKLLARAGLASRQHEGKRPVSCRAAF